jgi:hypothetical protein
MKTLQDAWNWYESATNQLTLMQRLGTHHWNNETLANASIWNDDKFKEIEAQDIVDATIAAISPMEDLGVLVLFSVFEATVRDHLEQVIAPLAKKQENQILVHAAQKALEGIRDGSFANHVLLPLQKQKRISHSLADKVNQVRDYRNWVAHGKRPGGRKRKIEQLSASETFSRLNEFLEALGIATESERANSDLDTDSTTERPSSESF